MLIFKLLAVAVNCKTIVVYMARQVTVLIVDDNNFVRESLRVVLAGVEDIVISGEAKNGEEAISLARELCPSIILMDINMSPVNGFEATRKILRENPSIRIIGLSLHKEASYCKNLLRLGARGYVIKSTPYSELVIAIREVLAGKKYIDKDLDGEI